MPQPFGFVIPSAARNLLFHGPQQALLRLLHGQQEPCSVRRHDRILNAARTAAQGRECEGFTKKYNVNRLVYYETFKYVGNAINRETEIKKWRREKKVALIEKDNPTWEDLSEPWGKPMQLLTADSSLRSE
ncbi:MAG: hypothetical protein ACHP9S_02755 [Terriglobales bacterium]